MVRRESAPTLPQPALAPVPSPGEAPAALPPVGAAPIPNFPEQINWGPEAAAPAAPNTGRPSVERARTSLLVDSVVQAGKRATHLNTGLNDGFRFFGDGGTEQHHTIGSGIPVLKEIERQSKDWREHPSEAVSFTSLVEPDMLTIIHPARTETGKRGKTTRIPEQITSEANPLAGQTRMVLNEATGLEEPAVRFRYQFRYSDKAIIGGVHGGELPNYKEYRGSREGQHVMLGVDLPKSIADELQASIRKDPATARTVARRLFLENNDGVMTENDWDNGGSSGHPVRPPYEGLGDWNMAIITGQETTGGGYRNHGYIEKGYSVDRVPVVAQTIEGPEAPADAPVENTGTVAKRTISPATTPATAAESGATAASGATSTTPEAVAAPESTPALPLAAARTGGTGRARLKKPRKEFMPSNPRTKRISKIDIDPDTDSHPIADQLYSDAAKRGRSDLVGLTWTGDGATFRVSNYRAEARTVDKFGVDMGKYNRGTNKLHDKWRGEGVDKHGNPRKGALAKNWRVHGMFPPRFHRYHPGHHESLYEQQRGFSPRRSNAFVTPNNSLRLRGFQLRSHERSGMGFYGTATMETSHEHANWRTVDVIRDGRTTRSISFANDGDLQAFLNNDGKSERLGIKEPLGFEDFGWEAKDTAPKVLKDVIPASTEPHHPMSLTLLEGQRRRMDLKDMTGVTWTDANGRKQQIIQDYMIKERPNNYTPHEVAKQQFRVQTEHRDAGGRVFYRARVFNAESLQRHFDAIGAKKTTEQSDPHWEVPQLPKTDIRGRLLRHQEMERTTPAAGEQRAEHYRRTANRLGKFATGLVVPKMERDTATDPGVTLDEAIGLLADPDRLSAVDWRKEVRKIQGTPEPDSIYATLKADAPKLQETINELGSRAVGETADTMLKQLQNELNRLGMHEEAGQTSISWAYRQLANAYTYKRDHPDEAMDERGLHAANPFEITQEAQVVRQQMVDTMIGELFLVRGTMTQPVLKRGPDGSIVQGEEYAVNNEATKSLPDAVRKRIRAKLANYRPDMGQIPSPVEITALGTELRFGYHDSELPEKKRRAARKQQPAHKV